MPSNATHRKAIARAYAAATNLSYAQALEAVRTAARADLLPEHLDEGGIALAVQRMVERPDVVQTTRFARTGPRNIPSHAIAEVPPEDLKVGMVTIYGVIIDVRPGQGGFFLDFPHNTAIFAGEDETVSVIARVDEYVVQGIVEAFEASRP